MKTRKEYLELSYIMEDHYARQLGYMPTSHIDEHEWQAELKRLRLSNKQESLNEPKSEENENS